MTVIAPRKRPFLQYMTACFLVAAVIAAVAFFAAQDIESLRDRVRDVLATARGAVWAGPFVCLLYLAASATMFPVIVLNLATSLVFGPIWGTLYSLCGTLIAASVFFAIGRFGKRRGLDSALSRPRLSRINRALGDAGVIGVATLRLVPLAPFGIFNMAAGVTALRFIDYIGGTFIAFWPGGIARALVGDSLMQLFLNPTKETALYLGLGIAVWLTTVLTLHFWLKRFRRGV